MSAPNSETPTASGARLIVWLCLLSVLIALAVAVFCAVQVLA